MSQSAWLCDIKTKLDDSHLFSKAQPEDLMKYGFIPELIGRLPIIAPLEELTDETCKYMEGHPDEEHSSFCGRKTVEKFSYCPLHLMIIFWI